MSMIKINRLKCEIAKYSKFVLYGAGYIANDIYAELKKNDIFPDYCVVTEKSASQLKFYESELYTVADKIEDLRRSDVLVLIAVSEKYQKEIIKTLCEYNIQNYLPASIFLRGSEIDEVWEKRNEEECLQAIAEWYADVNELSTHDISWIRNELQQIFVDTKKDNNAIVFVVIRLQPRVLKIAEALKEKGYKIITLFAPVTINELVKEKMIQASDSSHQCNCIEELMYEIMLAGVNVVHVFSQYGKLVEIAYLLVKNKILFPKIVFDQYDISNEMYNGHIKQKWLDMEKYCVEYSDGICNRGYEIEYLTSEKGYNVTGKTIQFFDYCSNDVLEVLPQIEDGSLSLCYVGGILPEKEYPGMHYACWLDVIRLCIQNKCHLHVYAVNGNEERFADYIKLSEENEFFHFHEPIMFEQLAKELAQYDYGINPIRKGFDDCETDGVYSRNKMLYSTNNKYFDYLDAGLPIIGAMPVKLSEYFEKKGVLLNWTLEEYDFQKLRQLKEQMRQNVLVAREEFNMKNQIERLIMFYKFL